MKSLFILYVADQKRARDFYAAVLQQDPLLDVPGMTEFQLSEGTLLGLMPEAGIKRILGDPLPDPSAGNGIPRCELYLECGSEAQAFLNRAIEAGGKSLSPLQQRDWDDQAAYCMDPDGHVLALANWRAEK